MALAWIQSLPGIVPIPGTKRREYLGENVASTEITLSAAELKESDALVPSGTAAGGRYPEGMIVGETPRLATRYERLRTACSRPIVRPSGR